MNGAAEGRDPGGTAYGVRGDGPPLLLLHGVGMGREMWDRQVPALSERFTVVTFDLLGHGDSPKPPGPYGFELFVRQIATLADHLGIGRFGLGGFSFGGMVARAAAIGLAERVAALAILNSPHARSQAERAAIWQRLMQARAGGPAANVDAALERWFTPEHATRCPEDIELVRRWVVVNDPQGYAAAYTLLVEGDVELAGAVRQIRCPALVVSCDNDAGNSPRMAREMAALIPGAQVEIVPRLRHMGLFEDPAPFNDLLLRFFAGHLAAAGEPVAEAPPRAAGHDETLMSGRQHPAGEGSR